MSSAHVSRHEEITGSTASQPWSNINSRAKVGGEFCALGTVAPDKHRVADHACAPRHRHHSVHYRTLVTLSGFRDTSQNFSEGFQRVDIRADTMPSKNESFELDKGERLGHHAVCSWPCDREDKSATKPRSVSASGAYDETRGEDFLA